MSKTITITGKIVYKNLGIGFWGIEGFDGKEYRPVNMPEQLKTPGKTVTVSAKPVEDMSVFMWGTAVKVLGFET